MCVCVYIYIYIYIYIYTHTHNFEMSQTVRDVQIVAVTCDIGKLILRLRFRYSGLVHVKFVKVLLKTAL